jgi:hypothetical protein
MRSHVRCGSLANATAAWASNSTTGALCNGLVTSSRTTVVTTATFTGLLASTPHWYWVQVHCEKVAERLVGPLKRLCLVASDSD